MLQNTQLRYFYYNMCILIFNSSFQITVIGRYGSTNARAKIPLGFYYGHTYILPWESELKLMHDPLKGEGESANQPEIDQHLAMMVALQEDIQCRLVENLSYIVKLFLPRNITIQKRAKQGRTCIHYSRIENMRILLANW